MHFTPTTLADVDIAKMFMIVLFIVIWAIGAMASMVKKATEQAKARAAAARPPVVPSQTIVPNPAISQRRVASAMPQRRVVPEGAKQPAARRLAPGKKVANRAAALTQMTTRPAPPAPAQPTQTVLAGAMAITPQAKASPIGAKAPVRTAAGGVPANAATLRRWMTPRTMRQQFILTELLQPALALREKRD